MANQQMATQGQPLRQAQRLLHLHRHQLARATTTPAHLNDFPQGLPCLDVSHRLFITVICIPSPVTGKADYCKDPIPYPSNRVDTKDHAGSQDPIRF